jgi:hypothetical protein
VKVWIFKGEVFEKPKLEVVAEGEVAQAAAAAVAVAVTAPPIAAAEQPST